MQGEEGIGLQGIQGPRGVPGEKVHHSEPKKPGFGTNMQTKAGRAGSDCYLLFGKDKLTGWNQARVKSRKSVQQETHPKKGTGGFHTQEVKMSK